MTRTASDAMNGRVSPIHTRIGAVLEAKTISISIDRNWRGVYQAIRHPEQFPKWASGLSNSTLEPDGDRWRAQGPEGPVLITFTGHNEFGVMDHWVDLGGGRVVYVPLRVVENGDAAEVLITLFRQPDMSDAAFEQDENTIRRDLVALKSMVES
jgi:hypothetical protein